MTKVVVTESEDGPMVFLNRVGGQELTGDDLAQVLEMCVSEKTCAAREETLLALIEEVKTTLATMNLTMSSLGAVVGDTTTDVAILKEVHKTQAMSFNRKVAVAAIVVAAFGILVQQSWAILKPLIFK